MEQDSRNLNLQRDEEIVLASHSSPDEQVAEDPSREVRDQSRDFRYPLNGGLDTAPGRITFTAFKIEPFFDLSGEVKTNARKKHMDAAKKKVDEIKSQAQKKLSDAKSSYKEKDVEDAGTISTMLKSYENVTEGTSMGSVMFPLSRGLKYSDGVTYNVVDVGILGAAGDLGSASTDDGRLSGAAKSLAINAMGKALPTATSALVGAGLGKLGGGASAGALLGGVAGGNASAATGAIAQAATRVATAPNERTLFERVKMRSFGFGFTMIARDADESREIKNILKFFRSEVYPEAITIVDGGAPFAYEFPNVFQIDIKNRDGSNPGFNIQRCYLENVDTTFNGTSSGMYNGNEFVEVQVMLQFREISAMHKGKVSKGGF